MSYWAKDFRNSIKVLRYSNNKNLTNFIIILKSCDISLLNSKFFTYIKTLSQ